MTSHHPAAGPSTAVVAGVVVVAVLALLGGGVALVGSQAAGRPGEPVVAPALPGGVAVRDVDRPVSRGGERATAAVDPAWVARQSALTGIPVPALTAYAAAELALGREQPGCHLGWPTLAGLGWVESRHGTLGGRTVGPDGRSSSRILGVALDGRGPVARIPADAESHRLTGDPTWARAVGPLQFLPSTWRRWGVDADGDGDADPNDLDDAALSAGRYVCAAGDLRRADTWSAAVFSYNHAASYVLAVHAAADAYAVRSRG